MTNVRPFPKLAWEGVGWQRAQGSKSLGKEDGKQSGRGDWTFWWITGLVALEVLQPWGSLRIAGVKASFVLAVLAFEGCWEWEYELSFGVRVVMYGWQDGHGQILRE